MIEKNTFCLLTLGQKCTISVLWPFTNHNFQTKHPVCPMISALIKPLCMNMTLEGVTCLGEDPPSRCTQKIDPDWIQRSWSSHYVSIQDRKSKVINSSSLHFRHLWSTTRVDIRIPKIVLNSDCLCLWSHDFVTILFTSNLLAVTFETYRQAIFEGCANFKFLSHSVMSLKLSIVKGKFSLNTLTAKLGSWLKPPFG